MEYPPTSLLAVGGVISLFFADTRLPPECLQADQVALRFDVEQKIQ